MDTQIPLVIWNANAAQSMWNSLLPAVSGLVGVLIGIFGNLFVEKSRRKSLKKEQNEKWFVNKLNTLVQSITDLYFSVDENFAYLFTLPTDKKLAAYRLEKQESNSIWYCLKKVRIAMVVCFGSSLSEYEKTQKFYLEKYNPVSIKIHGVLASGVENSKALQKEITQTVLEFENLIKELEAVIIKEFPYHMSKINKNIESDPK